MTTQAVRAWISEDRNYVDIEFNASIDVSAESGGSVKIAKDNIGTTSTGLTGRTTISTNDSKFVRLSANNISVFKAWSNGEKQYATIEMTAGAFLDIAGNATGAITPADDIRAYFVKESSLGQCLNYTASGQECFLPPDTVIISDITSLDQPESEGEIKIYGFKTTLISGDITVGPVQNCSATDPLVLNLKDLNIDGDICFSTTNTAAAIDGTSNTGSDSADTTKYNGTSFTTVLAGSIANLTINVKSSGLPEQIINNYGSPNTAQSRDYLLSGNNWGAFKITNGSTARYLNNIVFGLYYLSTNYIKMYLYSDNAGSPNTELAVLKESILVSNRLDIDVDEKYLLAASTDYWIVFEILSGTSLINFYADNSNSNTSTAYGSNGSSWTTENQKVSYIINGVIASNSGSYLRAEIYTDDGGSPSKPNVSLGRSSNTFYLSSLGSTYQTETFMFSNINVDASTKYWIVIERGEEFDDLVNYEYKATGTDTFVTSTDASTWSTSNYTMYYYINVGISPRQYLAGQLENVSWKGNFKYNTSYYFAGLAISDTSKKFTLKKCSWNMLVTHNGTTEENWNCINTSISEGAALSAFFTATNGNFTYCNFASGATAFSTAKTIYNCYIGNVGSALNDITNESGLTGVALANSQGYGYISGKPLNAGKEWTQTGVGDDPGEKSIGVPKGLMCGVGAFSNIPAVVIEPTAAAASTNTVTLSVPVNSFVPGDTIRLLPRNIQNAAGQTIAQNSQASTIAIA